MATQEKQNPYHEGGTSTPGFGTGGKFRKPPSRRTQTTPYDRPPNSLRNPIASRNNGNGGWFSKLVVDPAHRLISNSAHSIFSSLFRKRLPAPPPPPTPAATAAATTYPSSSEAKREVRETDNCQEKATFFANNSSGMQQGGVGESSNGGGISELEQLLRQKTFTRSEIDRLTALMRSRTVDAPAREEEERTEVIASEPMLTCEQKEECLKTPALENGIEHRLTVTPYAAPSDVASPAELAKAYMGSRPSKVSSVMSGVQSPLLRDDAIFLKSENFPLKSSLMSIVPRATRHAAAHENGFVTPRSRGRSAIYSMARTPYSRVYPTSTLKGGRLAIEGEPSSTTQSTLDHGMQSGSRQGAVKRRSLALDNDLGSVGPIRRVRHKSNLLYSKGVGTDPVQQQPSSSIQKPTVLGEVKHSHGKLSEENLDGTAPKMSFPSLPSKLSEMASKILQQLDKLVSPAEKSSESRQPTVMDKSPMKLSPSMLRGQALRSMETVDSSKLLDSIQDNKYGTLGNSSNIVQKTTSQIDKVENGPLKLDAPSGGSVPVIADADATNQRTQLISSAKPGDSSMVTSVSHTPLKKRAFHMSAHEDFVDLDDDVYPNGNVSSFPNVEKETKSSIAAEETNSHAGAIAQENSSTLSVAKPSKDFTTDGEAHVRTADGSRVGQKVDISTPLTSSIPVPTLNSVTATATQTGFGSDKPASSNGSIANPPSFNIGNKVVSSTAAGAPSDEIAKSGPFFGLEKVSQKPCTSSAGGESNLPKFGASNSMVGSSFNFGSTSANGAADSMPKAPEPDKADSETKTVSAFSVRPLEPTVSSAASTSLSASSTSVFNIGHSSTSNQNKGSISLNSTFSSPSSSFSSNNFTSPVFGGSSLAPSNSISATTAPSGSTLSSNPIIFSSSNNNSSTTVVASSSSTTSMFQFGSNPAQSTGLPVSSGSEPQDTKNSQDAEVGNLRNTSFGSSSAAGGSSGSGIFGFSSSSMKSLNSQSQGSVIGATAGNGSMFGSQVVPATGGFATSTQTQPVPFGLSASSPSFGLTGSTTFSSGSSIFTSSSPSTNTTFSSGSTVFASSSPAANIFNSGSTFGLGTSVSTSAANSVGSNGGTSSMFGTSSWQPNKSPFGSAFSSSSGFSFGASTTTVASTASSPFRASTASVASSSSPFGASSASVGSSNSLFGTSAASTPQFSFNSAAATTSTQPSFGSPSPAFSFGAAAPVNNDQRSMEDSMAEDTIQASPPVATPIFGQQPAPVQPNFVSAPVQPNFSFGAQAPSGGSPFQFGGQQTPQNLSPFQASGSIEFNAGGGSFSLGTGGGDKANRRIFKVKHKQRKK